MINPVDDSQATQHIIKKDWCQVMIDETSKNIIELRNIAGAEDSREAAIVLLTHAQSRLRKLEALQIKLNRRKISA